VPTCCIIATDSWVSIADSMDFYKCLWFNGLWRRGRPRRPKSLSEALFAHARVRLAHDLVFVGSMPLFDALGIEIVRLGEVDLQSLRDELRSAGVLLITTIPEVLTPSAGDVDKAAGDLLIHGDENAILVDEIRSGMGLDSVAKLGEIIPKLGGTASREKIIRRVEAVQHRIGQIDIGPHIKQSRVENHDLSSAHGGRL